MDSRITSIGVAFTLPATHARGDTAYVLYSQDQVLPPFPSMLPCGFMRCELYWIPRRCKWVAFLFAKLTRNSEDVGPLVSGPYLVEGESPPSESEARNAELSEQLICHPRTPVSFRPISVQNDCADVPGQSD